MTLHIFGDSHASDIISGWRDCTNIKSYHLGPILCYSVGKEKLKRIDIRQYKIKDGDSVLFCFGEIDCRFHIHKHITNDITYQDIINDLITNYIDAIKVNISHCKVNLKNVCAYNVIPPARKKDTRQHKRFPHLGTDEERKNYVLYFNMKLKEMCEQNNILFFDIYDKYIDSDGYLNKEMSDGNVHIYDGKYLQEFIDKFIPS